MKKKIGCTILVLAQNLEQKYSNESTQNVKIKNKLKKTSEILSCFVCIRTTEKGVEIFSIGAFVLARDKRLRYKNSGNSEEVIIKKLSCYQSQLWIIRITIIMLMMTIMSTQILIIISL